MTWDKEIDAGKIKRSLRALTVAISLANGTITREQAYRSPAYRETIMEECNVDIREKINEGNTSKPPINAKVHR